MTAFTRDQLRGFLRNAWKNAGVGFMRLDVGAIGEAIIEVEHPDWRRARDGTRGYDFIDGQERRVQIKTHGQRVRRGFDDVRPADIDRVILVQLLEDDWQIICDRLTAPMFNADTHRPPSTHRDKWPIYRHMRAVELIAA
jgi:hypothetical protein